MIGLLAKLSPRALQVLTVMAQDEHDEDHHIAVCGIQCWLGAERTSRAVVDQLLSCCAIRGDRIGSTTYYSISESGHHIVARPELAGEISLAILKGQNFTVNKEHRVIKI